MQISILGTDGAYLANNGSNAISILGPDGNLLPNDGTNFVCVTGSDGAYQPNDGTREAFSILGTDGALKPYEEGNSFSVLDENGALAIPVTDNLIGLLLWGGAEGAWYDPSDLSTMFQTVDGIEPVTATGQSVGVILDKSLGLARSTRLAEIDQFTFTPQGSTPPTTNSATTFAGETCVSVTFPVLASGGYGVSRAEGAGSDAQFSATTGEFFHVSYEIACSRELTATETIVVYFTGASGGPAVVLNAGYSPTTWQLLSELPQVGFATGEKYPVIYTSTPAILSEITVYLRAVKAEKLAGNHAIQATSASRPVFRDVDGLRYLEFDGVDDYLRATFTIAQPIDRISALQQVTWTGLDQLYGGASANAGSLFQSTATPQIALFSGAAAGLNGGLAVGANGVVTERHDGASSRLAVNGGAYVTGNAGTTLPGGVTIGASNVPSVYSNLFLFQLIMRGSTTAMTDAQIAACRALCAAKSGVTL